MGEHDLICHFWCKIHHFKYKIHHLKISQISFFAMMNFALNRVSAFVFKMRDCICNCSVGAAREAAAVSFMCKWFSFMIQFHDSVSFANDCSMQNDLRIKLNHDSCIERVWWSDRADGLIILTDGGGIFEVIVLCTMMYNDVQRRRCKMMLNDVQWCTMMYNDVDVKWCTMMYNDVQWCTLMYNDVQWCTMMYNDVDVKWC